MGHWGLVGVYDCAGRVRLAPLALISVIPIRGLAWCEVLVVLLHSEFVFLCICGISLGETPGPSVISPSWASAWPFRLVGLMYPLQLGCSTWCSDLVDVAKAKSCINREHLKIEN